MKPIDVRKRTVGINFNKSGEAEILIWAPEAKLVELNHNNKRIPLHKEDFGYWQTNSNLIKPNDLYSIIIDEKELPDPASLAQPEGVHGLSKAIDLNSFKWSDEQWKNISLKDYIIYELHTGTFSPQGTFEGIGEKLDHLKELGITAIEIMPIAQFPGNRNWGYDGVFPFAVQNSYGGVEGLAELVNLCHQKEIAVVLDVVYNHLGPEGNYLQAFGPYFTDKYKTPWGNAINFDDAWCDGVRQYFIENALMWFRDFHIDALRLDAVHAIKDFSPNHILKEIKQHVDILSKITGHNHNLIVESDLNDNRFINPIDECGYGMDAQWIDEFHHALRVTAGEKRTGYYSDFDGITHLAKSYKDAYVFDGQFSPHRKRNFGVKTENPGDQFIVFSQNHDQVGNRMLGERTSTLVSFEMQKLLAGAVMVSPYLPMLFMGEEWSEPHPFQYFVSHTDPELAEAVRKGRKEEFAAFHIEGEAPDPMAEQTFQHSKLQWDLLKTKHHQIMFRYYQQLITLRKKQPALNNSIRNQLLVECNPEWQTINLHRWSDGQQLICLMNFSKKQQQLMLPSIVDNWNKMLDSADPQWQGSLAAPETVSGGTPGTTGVILQPESLLIYSNNIYS